MCIRDRIWDESLHVRRVHALALDSIPSILKFSDWGKTSFTVEFLNRDGWSLESVLSLLDEMLEEFSPMIVTYNIAFNVLLFKFSDSGTLMP